MKRKLRSRMEMSVWIGLCAILIMLQCGLDSESQAVAITTYIWMGIIYVLAFDTLFQLFAFHPTHREWPDDRKSKMVGELMFLRGAKTGVDETVTSIEQGRNVDADLIHKQFEAAWEEVKTDFEDIDAAKAKYAEEKRRDMGINIDTRIKKS